MKNNILISTGFCYEGHDTKEDCYTIDTYYNLSNDPDIENNSIEFSQEAWKDEKNYFMEMLQNEINNHENRYKTNIVGIALIGHIGLWTGKHHGGKIYNIDDIENIFNMEVNDIEAIVNNDRSISILGHHHDGSHNMNICFITENKLKKASLYNDYECYGIEELNNITDIEKLSQILKPLKLSKNNGYFNINIAV